jgi:hypothetical protein
MSQPYRGERAPNNPGELLRRRDPGISDAPRRINTVCARPRLSSAETEAKPTQYVGGISTPSAPPITQAVCSTVSDLPNAEARDASGTLRWITASRHTLATALPVAATRAVTAAMAMPDTSAVRTAIVSPATTHPTIA